jgi:hypothetical protein
VTDPVAADRTPALGLPEATALLAARAVAAEVALIGVRGFFGALGPSPGNDPGVYDDAVFLVTSEACRGFLFNTDPTRFEPPNVTLKTGLWRYRPGRHAPERGEAYDALVQSGSVVWVTAYPRSLDDYRLFGRLPNVALGADLASVDAYRDALRQRGGRVLENESIEWPMQAHINIHRGGSEDTGSKGCQTVHPSMWDDFIGSVYGELRTLGQAEIPYLLVEARDVTS